jgi:hypothetical protein
MENTWKMKKEGNALPLPFTVDPKTYLLLDFYNG